MSQESLTDIKKMMNFITDDSVVTARLLHKNGVSYDRLVRYKQSGWLDEIGHGAYCRHGRAPSIFAALDAVNYQLETPVRVGGKSALARAGYLQFLPLSSERLTLYAPRGVVLPKWFEQRYVGQFTVSHTMVIPDDSLIGEGREERSRFLQSDAERAILELLESVPRKVSLAECYQILELMNALRANAMSDMLSVCTSVKVKRLFLLLAEDCGHPWFARLRLQNVDLGKGCRMIDSDGQYNAKYNLVVKPWREI